MTTKHFTGSIPTATLLCCASLFSGVAGADAIDAGNNATEMNPNTIMPSFGKHRIPPEKEVDLVTGFIYSP